MKFPALIFNLSLDPGSFDVNVTPDKRTIFIQQESLLISWVKEIFLELFEPFRRSDHIFLSQSSGKENNLLSTFTVSSQPEKILKNDAFETPHALMSESTQSTQGMTSIPDGESEALGTPVVVFQGTEASKHCCARKFFLVKMTNFKINLLL